MLICSYARDDDDGTNGGLPNASSKPMGRDTGDAAYQHRIRIIYEYVCVLCTCEMHACAAHTTILMAAADKNGVENDGRRYTTNVNAGRAVCQAPAILIHLASNDT